MAESVLFSLAESLMEKLASRTLEEASRVLNVYDDLREMNSTLSIIKAVLLDAEQKQHQNNLLGEWLSQIKHVFSDAENIVDDFECEAMRKRVVNTQGSVSRKVRHFFSSSNPLAYRFKMAREIKEINKRLDRIARDRFNYDLRTIHSDTRVGHTRETHSFVNPSDVIGREHDKTKIIELLLQDNDVESLGVIPIVGIGGLGKTQLAKTVFNDKSIEESFPLKMWVCVSNDFELKKVLVKILNSAPNPNREKYERFEMEQLKNHLMNKLARQKFLLVLDDVWNEDGVKWVELKNLIQEGAEGSKVLVTTRTRCIGNMMATKPSYSYPLEGLSEMDSLTLFVKRAFQKGQEERYPELLSIGKDIVKKCGGLPLAVITLAHSLHLKVDIEKWKSVRDNEIWNLPPEDDNILPALKLSYDQLPTYLKRCFACFSLFEKDYDFTSIYIIELWKALGFLSLPRQNITLEDFGNQLLHELFSRSFLQDFINLGGACRFKLHDLVHDLALYVTKDEFQLLKSHCQNISPNVKHLSLIGNDLLGQVSIPTGLRSIYFPGGADNKAFLNSIVSRCTYLRLLDLSYSKYKRLPRSIGNLKHLRHLDLEKNENLERLPDSVCKLQNLQTLNLRGCKSLETLPKNMKNLINLQTLRITSNQSSFPNKEIAELAFLYYLSFYSCNNVESLFEGIQLPNLKWLWIKSCENLKSLPFHVIPNLEALLISNCNELHLSKEGRGNEVPESRLKLLSLDDLPQLVSLPQWLQGSSETLHSLMITDCVNLEELPEWFSTLICLKTLVVINCPKLISLPENMICLENMEYLEIKDCPELCERYQPKVGQDWPQISHIKRVIIPEPRGNVMLG